MRTFLNLVNPEAYKEIIFKQDVEAQKFIAKWAVWLLPCRRIFLALEACLELGHSDLDEDPNAKYREKAIYVTTSVLSNRERYVILRTCDSVFFLVAAWFEGICSSDEALGDLLVAKKLPQDISSLSKDADAVTRKLKEARTKRANCPQCYVWRLCVHVGQPFNR